MIRARILGRTDDGRHLVLRQEGAGGSAFRWPAPEGRGDADGGTAVLTVRPGRAYQVAPAGGYVFFIGVEHELALWFDLLPVLPPRVDVEVVLLPAEEREGVEAA